MQCDNCGKETEDIEFRAGYNLAFCDSANVSIAEESCMEKFERKLWEEAQANKQAKHKTESTATEASGNSGEMVERITGKR